MQIIEKVKEYEEDGKEYNHYIWNLYIQRIKVLIISNKNGDENHTARIFRFEYKKKLVKDARDLEKSFPEEKSFFLDKEKLKRELLDSKLL